MALKAFFVYIDESGFSKKGKDSVGVSRQYNGRMGKVDNCQVGVIATLCDGTQSSIVNNRLFLPKEWVEDGVHCDKAKIPLENRVFKKKQELARDMVDEYVKDSLSLGWVAMDALYGRDSKFTNYLNDNKILYVADVPCDKTISFRQIDLLISKYLCGNLYPVFQSRTLFSWFRRLSDLGGATWNLSFNPPRNGNGVL